MAKQKQKQHYVNNAEFSQAVVDYVKRVKDAEEREREIPVVPDYIARCLVAIAEGLSHKPNFIRYTYREEMVMDAVENCLKALKNYNIDASTRTGKPNAFGYFTQITYFAFLRRISKEKKQQDIRMKYMSSAGVDMFASVSHASADAAQTSAVTSYIDTLRSRMDKIRHVDDTMAHLAEEEKRREKQKSVSLSDSNSEEVEHDD